MTTPEPDNASRRAPAWLWAGWALSLLITVALALDLSPWLRGDNDWRWIYRPVAITPRLAVVILALLAYIALAALVWRWAAADSAGPHRARWAVVFAVIAGIALPVVAILIVEPDPLRDLLWRTISPGVGGYHRVAYDTPDTLGFLRDFPQLTPGYLAHPQRHPPGHILYFMLINQALAQLPDLTTQLAALLPTHRCEFCLVYNMSDMGFVSALGGLVMLPLNALAVVPLYAAGRELFGRRAVLAAVLISPLVPAYTLWAGQWDSAFTIVTTTLLWLLHLALARRQGWAWWAAGLLLSISSFTSHATLTLLAFVGFYTLINLWLAREDWLRRWRWLLLHGAGFLIMLCSVWIVYWLGFGVTFLDVWHANTAPHFELGTQYWLRLAVNPYDYGLFLGIALVLPGLAALAAALQQIARRRPPTPGQVVVLATGLTIAALTVSGSSRAEVGRVWLFLMPLSVLAAAAPADGPARSTGRWALTAFLLAAQLVVMQTVLELQDGRRPPVERLSQAPAGITPVGLAVGDELVLEGYTLSSHEARPGDTLDLMLVWQVVETPPAVYVSFAHVYDAGRGMAAQHDEAPHNGMFTSECWLPGEVVLDHKPIAIPQDAGPGNYALLVGMYTWPETVRLPVSGPDTQDNMIRLAGVTIAP